MEASDWLDWAYRQCVYVVCTVRTVEEVEISSTSSMKAVRRTTQPIAFPGYDSTNPAQLRHLHLSLDAAGSQHKDGDVVGFAADRLFYFAIFRETSVGLSVRLFIGLL